MVGERRKAEQGLMPAAVYQGSWIVCMSKVLNGFGLVCSGAVGLFRLAASSSLPCGQALASSHLSHTWRGTLHPLQRQRPPV
ncbi:hypothetical protein TgHK011_007946 [Trichoderma gracile]|nr:hypothetical protein TgHK011_007946 [Trichoderma gracile]